MEILRRSRHILLYSFVIAILIFGLKWMQWQLLIVDHAIDIYIGLIAVLFTALGVWVASQLMTPKTQTVIVEKEVLVQQPEEFVLNEVELAKLELSKREFEILQLLAQGHSNAEIAGSLFLSLSTIKTHTSNLYSKMQVRGRFQAVAKAKQLNIIRP